MDCWKILDTIRLPYDSSAINNIPECSKILNACTIGIGDKATIIYSSNKCAVVFYACVVCADNSAAINKRTKNSTTKIFNTSIVSYKGPAVDDVSGDNISTICSDVRAIGAVDGAWIRYIAIVP